MYTDKRCSERISTWLAVVVCHTSGLKLPAALHCPAAKYLHNGASFTKSCLHERQGPQASAPSNLAAVLTSLSPRPLRLMTMRVPSGTWGHSVCATGQGSGSNQ